MATPVVNTQLDTLNAHMVDVVEALDSLAAQAGTCLVISTASFSSLPQTITNSSVTANHVVVNSVLSNPIAQTGEWTVTTAAGSLTIAGSISGTTTLTLYLNKQA